ncbi:MAG: PrsW family intramembrane metalloprotease [Anaerolineae bacterium]|nr:PrsW family intramembrane metalloprotease [Anaerolineae bacterium]
MTIAAYLIAIIIPALVIYLFITLDVFGTGKANTILLCAAWGAVAAYQIAVWVNNAVIDTGLSYETLTKITAPIIEEILKSLILLYLIRQPSFRYIVDGAIYGIAVGMGFALSENLFVYLPGSGSAVLGTAISRTLSTSLMHAAASGLVGLSLGRLRRTTAARRNVWPVLGIGLAIALHVIYNNVVSELNGIMLLLVAVGTGIGGGVLIAWQINQGLLEEKRRFSHTLGLDLDVSTGERKAVQQLGVASMETIFRELGEFFGTEHITLIRHLLVVQANIGILQNNLSSPVSDRLRAAWLAEITEYRAEIERTRNTLNAPVRLFLQTVFPGDDATMQTALNEELARSDPTLVHTFDMFMRVSELAETFTPEQLAAFAQRLSHIQIFKNVSLANLENLSRAISVQSFDNGTLLFHEGAKGDAMYLIEDGQIDIFVRDQAGQEKPLRTFEPGSVVGEFSLLDGRPRSASARANGPLKVLVLQREVFIRFIQSRPKVVLAMLQYLAEKVRFTTTSVEIGVNWMTQISAGNYAAVQTTDTHMTGEIMLEPDEISEQTVMLVEDIFSAAASKLHEREQTIRTGTA